MTPGGAGLAPLCAMHGNVDAVYVVVMVVAVAYVWFWVGVHYERHQVERERRVWWERGV